MKYAMTPDNVKLYYEEVGQGTPIVFVHEFAGDTAAGSASCASSASATGASSIARGDTSHPIFHPIPRPTATCM